MIQLSYDRAEDIIASLCTRFGDVSPRVTEMLLLLASSEQPVLPDERGAANLYLPSLPTKPWFDPGTFAWTRAIEDAAGAILAEYLQNAEHDLAYYLGEPDRAAAPQRDENGLLHPAFGWRGVMFRRGGIWNRPLCQRYPAVINALRTVPLAAGDVMLSVLAPSSKIVPHTGLTNLDLTCHIGLDIPPECGIEVGNETRTWQRGKCLVFDDTYRHWAWNKSEQPRLVLLFDFWHPGLAPTEIAQLKHALPLIYRPAAAKAA